MASVLRKRVTVVINLYRRDILLVEKKGVGLVQTMSVKLLLAPEFGIFIGLFILVLIFQGLSGRFFSVGEIGGASTMASTIGVIGVGVAFLMISGEFDLSVGAVAAFVSIIMGDLILKASWSPLPALLVALLCGMAIGLFNGVVTLMFNIPSFITTLGSYFMLNGINYIITGGYTVDVFGHGITWAILGGQPKGWPVAAPFLWMIVMGIVGMVVLSKTQYGNWVLAAGSKGGGSAKAVGVPVRRVKLINFAMCAFLAGLSGCLALAQYGSASSGFASQYNLLAIVAAVLGGTSLFGGKGSIGGTIVGACVLGVLDTGLVLVGAPGTWYTVFIGGILILAVIANVRLDRFGNLLAIGSRRSGS